MSSPVGPPTDTELLVLLATRLRGRGTAVAISEMFRLLGGDPAFDVESALVEARAKGRVRSRGEEGRRSLTPSGEVELAAHLGAETEVAGRADIGTIYEAFLVLNRAFLAVLSAGPGEPRRLEALGALIDRLGPVLATLSERLGRFDGYAERFRHARRAAETDADWIESPSVDSIHTIWFELHEHLLATLGRDRSDER